MSDELRADSSEEAYDMDKLFAAFSERHPGFELQDVKFIMDPSEASGQSVASLDERMAEIVRTAEPLENAEEFA